MTSRQRSFAMVPLFLLVPILSISKMALVQAFQDALPPVDIRLALQQEQYANPAWSRKLSTSLKCQLLGMSSANPTEFALTWPSFCERGGISDIHADGWGLVSSGAGLEM
mmetsp:Transcript_18164/g.37537  ORF Transcript_18164/g.37537 Transcript_18164/m.37537 type:complete len:110 (+) Transcript_18164:558-887(+)